MSETIEGRAEALEALAQATEIRNLPSTGPVGGAAIGFAQTSGAIAVAVRRDIRRVLNNIKALAGAAGEDWYYRFPVKNRRTGKTDYIEGPSIKLANDLAREYGNCEVDCRVMDLGDHWLIYARFNDLETGFSMTRPFQQNKAASKLGGEDDARRLDIALQIGASKAIRNVVVAALQTYSDEAFRSAKNSLVERIGKDIAGWRQRVSDRITEHGVDLKRVENVVGRVVGDWLAPDVAKVVAMMRAISEGMATVDETFPPLLHSGVRTTVEKPAAEKPAEKPAAEKKAAPKPAAKPKAPESAGEAPQTAKSPEGTKEPEKPTRASAEAPSEPESASEEDDGSDPELPAEWISVFDRIVSDLEEAPNAGEVEATLELFADQIAIFREDFSHHAGLIDEAADAARERVA